MAYLNEEKINKAVWACLDRCIETDDVISQIAKFLEETRATGEFREPEIHEVELAVLIVLNQIVEHPI